MYPQIVYDASRVEKTWTINNSCKLPPKPKGKVAKTRCGLDNFPLMVHILFFPILWPKNHIHVFEPEEKVVLLARIW